MQIAISAFLGESKSNASEAVLRSLVSSPPRNVEAHLRDIQVHFIRPRTDEIETAANRILREPLPSFCLLTGQAPGRNILTLERVSTNIRCFRTPDSSGSLPRDVPAILGGPTAYYSSFTPRELAYLTEALVRRGIPASTSNNAGTHLCNQLYYSVLHAAHLKRAATRALFLHVLPLPEHVAAGRDDIPSMSLELQRQAIDTIVGELFALDRLGDGDASLAEAA